MFPPQCASAQLTPDQLAALVEAARAESQALVANSDSLPWDNVETTPEQLRAQVSTLRQGTVELERHVQNLWLLATFRRAGFRFQLRPTAMAAWLDEVLPALRLQVAGSGQTLQVVRRGALPDILIDRHHLTQALINLVVSARADSGTQRPIELSVTARKDVVRVAVVDSGPPLREPVPDGAFMPAVRVTDADRSSPLGPSLGLALTQAIVEAHGGQTGAANCQGGGAILWFELPALAARSRLA